MAKSPKKSAKPKTAAPKKAAAKSTPKTSDEKPQPAPVMRGVLIASAVDDITIEENSSPANVNTKFLSGAGKLTISLFRKGLLINMQSVSKSADVHLSDVQTDDAISVVGAATGSVTITITPVSTLPSTPDNFEAGPVMGAYLIV